MNYSTVAVRVLFLASTFAGVSGCAHAPQNATPTTSGRKLTVQSGTLPASWYAGGKEKNDRPEFQIHAYNDDLYILRQAAYSNYEKPFLYLIFGRDRAILFDTGAGNVNVADAVLKVVQQWCAKHGRASIPLVVAHTHGHGDHVAGDAQFANREGVTVVGKDTASVRKFFGIAHWPDDAVTFDLGDRVLDILPIPGHQAASIAIYDRRTTLMLTGDTFYPGRLYVRDGVAFTNSIQRLVDFTKDKPVAHFLGTHIENRATPFEDYEVGTVDQPNEHVLELTRAQLVELDDALKQMNGKVVKKVLRDLTVWPVTP